jgi:hypothetical protein
MTRYRFLDPMGDVVTEGEFARHDEALEEAKDRNADPDGNEEIQRVEFLGPEGDWRWAGPLRG